MKSQLALGGVLLMIAAIFFSFDSGGNRKNRGGQNMKNSDMAELFRSKDFTVRLNEIIQKNSQDFEGVEILPLQSQNAPLDRSFIALKLKTEKQVSEIIKIFQKELSMSGSKDRVYFQVILSSEDVVSEQKFRAVWITSDSVTNAPIFGGQKMEFK